MIPELAVKEVTVVVARVVVEETEKLPMTVVDDVSVRKWVFSTQSVPFHVSMLPGSVPEAKLRLPPPLLVIHLVVIR